MNSNITFLKTKKFDYLYDGNTGYILRIQPLVKKILAEYDSTDQNKINQLLRKKYAVEEIEEAWQQIAEAKQCGLLSDEHKELFLDFIIKQLPYNLENSLSGICLAITEQCNLRCAYCTYSGIYGEQNRRHSNQHMSFMTAKKAIDYTILRSSNWDEYHLSFYGGEPLIRFDFIKRCINYLITEYPGKMMDFNITTNGTLLTAEKMDFLVKHDVRLYVSLDGPEEYHDEYRRYISNKGSFRDIKKNLLEIKERYPDYYYNKVNFGITLSPYRSLEQIEKFIVEDEVFYDNCYIRISSVNGDLERDIYADKRTENALLENYIEKYFLDLRYLLSKVHGDKVYLHKTRVAEKFCDLVDISTRRKTMAGERILPGGPCIPGSRLFVTTGGGYMICERGNELAGCFQLGNVDEGLNVEKASQILRDYYQLTPKECLNCWAYLNCSICPVQVEKDKQLSRSKKLAQCEYVKQRLIYELTLYLAILEKNPLAFGAI